MTYCVLVCIMRYEIFTLHNIVCKFSPFFQFVGFFLFILVISIHHFVKRLIFNGNNDCNYKDEDENDDDDDNDDFYTFSKRHNISSHKWRWHLITTIDIYTIHKEYCVPTTFHGRNNTKHNDMKTRKGARVLGGKWQMATTKA